MKKTYKNPELEVVMIATQQMLAASITVDTGSTPTDPGTSDAHEFADDFEF